MKNVEISENGRSTTTSNTTQSTTTPTPIGTITTSELKQANLTETKTSTNNRQNDVDLEEKENISSIMIEAAIESSNNNGVKHQQQPDVDDDESGQQIIDDRPIVPQPVSQTTTATKTAAATNNNNNHHNNNNNSDTDVLMDGGEEEEETVEMKPPPTTTTTTNATVKVNGNGQIKKESVVNSSKLGNATSKLELRLMLKQLHAELRQEESKMLLLKRLNYAQKLPAANAPVPNQANRIVAANGQIHKPNQQPINPTNKVIYVRYIYVREKVNLILKKDKDLFIDIS
jgi:hypothetical protein